MCVKCYIKNEERNTKNKTEDFKEWTTGNLDNSQHVYMNHYTSLIRYTITLKWSGRPTESFTPLNTHRKHIWRQILHTHNICLPPASKSEIMGPDPNRWCKFHTFKGHHIEYCYNLKNYIEFLIQ